MIVEEERICIQVDGGSSEPFIKMQCAVQFEVDSEMASGFIDSGASINVVSPSFLEDHSLEDLVHEHDASLSLTMANDKTETVQKKTIELSVRIDGLEYSTAEFLVLPVPANRDLLLGMPWLKSVNPQIDWVTGEIRPSRDCLQQRLRTVLASKTNRRKGKASARTNGASASYFSMETGETRLISTKQFRRMIMKDKTIEYVFVIQPGGVKPATRATDIEDYKNHPVYPYLRKYPGLFRQKLPPNLPPVEHGLHRMDVKSNDPIFRQQWRQSPVQEAEITRWVREMEAVGYIRRSTSPHGAPTFCVRKPDGWRIVHDFRAMNLNTVRRTMPMPRKDKILETMQGAYYYSCLDLLSGYYQFRMREADIPFTAFQAPDGLYEYSCADGVVKCTSHFQ